LIAKLIIITGAQDIMGPSKFHKYLYL
jgi:hypothetical protein